MSSHHILLAPLVSLGCDHSCRHLLSQKVAKVTSFVKFIKAFFWWIIQIRCCIWLVWCLMNHTACL